MEVQLYVYDLSQGLARQYSRALTGVQIDAIYHTAIVFGNVEYFFGQGVHRKVPGTTHHGAPMKVIPLGTTSLPMDVITEYVQSLEAIYTPESYDLFLHNCNNFSQDLSMFLVGKSIPDEIRELPETFLRTPMGQMVRGQLDQSMRQMTQAPDAVAGVDARPPAVTNGSHAPSNGSQIRTRATSAVFSNGKRVEHRPGRVRYPKSTTELDRLLQEAQNTCAVIFFTSATCPPCKIVYPVYDELAAEAGNKAVLIKVDVSQIYDIAVRYQIRATPTFFTYLKGKKDQEWSGADGGRLRGNVRLLVQMTSPQHPHTRLRVPSLHDKILKPIMYTKVPPLDKLTAKIGPGAKYGPIQALLTYITKREKEGLENSPLPDMVTLSQSFTSLLQEVPAENRFAVIDLVRIAAIDTRVSSFLAEERDHKILMAIASTPADYSTAPYNVQVVTLQLICNLFGSTVFQEQLTRSENLRSMVERLAASCLLAQRDNARSLAAAVVYNLAAYDHNERIDGRADVVGVSSMSDLEAALVETVVTETESKETLHSLLMALGLLLYCAPIESAVWDLCSAMEVRSALQQKAKLPALGGEPMIREIGEELLAKGGNL